jgi:hypothetical protein
MDIRGQHKARASSAIRSARHACRKPAGEPRLQIRQPNVIRPLIAADSDPMAAMIIRAIDQRTANASSAHFCERDFLGPVGHTPMITPIAVAAKPLGLGALIQGIR